MSGTNCNISVGVHRSGSPHTAVWKRVKLTVTGNGASTVVCDRTYGGVGESPMDVSATVNLRFASTHFPDGSTITFKFEAWDAATGGTGDPTIDGTKTTEAYNKGLSWATHEEVNQQTQQLEYIANPTLPQYCAAAYIGAKQAWDYLKNSMNHQDMFPANKDNTNVQLEPDIAAPLKTKTFIFGFTHGWSTGIAASYDNGSSSGGHDDDVLTWANVASYVAGVSPNLRTAPPINMVIMYACSTCAGGSAAGSNAFGTTVGGVKIDNRAYMGLDDTVWSVVISNLNLKRMCTTHSVITQTCWCLSLALADGQSQRLAMPQTFAIARS